MGKLLHSKTFRSNLIKWIFLYVGALIVVTSVVTYSKYITQMTGTANARTAKFNIGVTQGTMCSTIANNHCGENLVYKPYDKIEYRFSVNTTGTEVTTDVVFRVNVDGNFKILSVSDGTNTVSTPGLGYDQILTDEDLGTSQVSYLMVTDPGTGEITDNHLNIVDTCSKDDVINKTYIVTIQYRRDQIVNADTEAHIFDSSSNPVVKVEYSAEQKD